jgi:hypothetical protein
MAYRKRNRRYPKRSHKSKSYYSTRQDNSTSLVEELGELLANGITWLWRLIFKRRSTPAQNLGRKITFRDKLASLPSAPELPLPYQRCDWILSKGERALWHPLYSAVKGRYRIFCKVRLYDVVHCPAHRADERRWFKKARAYHVDFVICQPKTTAPLLVIELDDRFHRHQHRQKVDAFKDQILAAAGMPLYRIPAQQAYDPLELAATIDRMIAEAETSQIIPKRPKPDR